MLSGEHVTDDAGTGFVHTAPGHGQEDYLVWLKSGRRDIPETVDANGAYFDSVALFAGLQVIETEGKKAGKFGPANGAVMDKLIEAGNLLARSRVTHSYPHSWRSKAPVIYRNTPQWFIRMDEPLSLSEESGFPDGRADRGWPDPAPARPASIDATAFHPRTGQTRIRAMVEGRPDWLISRQRAWGTPLAMFVDKASGRAAPRPRGQRPHPGRHRRARRRRLVHPPFRRVPRPRPRPGRLREGRGHPGRLVRQRLDPRLHPGRAATTAIGRPTSTWRAPTRPAAGSSRACWRPAAPAAARRTTRC